MEPQNMREFINENLLTKFEVADTKEIFLSKENLICSVSDGIKFDNVKKEQVDNNKFISTIITINFTPSKELHLTKCKIEY